MDHCEVSATTRRSRFAGAQIRIDRPRRIAQVAFSRFAAAAFERPDFKVTLMKILSPVLVGLALLVSPAAAQTSCAPYCDYLHDYGPRDLTYVRPGLFCYPRCFPDGTCAPYSDCSVSGPQRGRVTIRTFAAPVLVITTPTTATYYDPSIASIRPAPRRVKRVRR